MRLPIIPPSDLNAEQQPLYEDMRLGIAANFQGFVNVRDDGALLGPWNPWMLLWSWYRTCSNYSEAAPNMRNTTSLPRLFLISLVAGSLLDPRHAVLLASILDTYDFGLID